MGDVQWIVVYILAGIAVIEAAALTTVSVLLVRSRREVARSRRELVALDGAGSALFHRQFSHGVYLPFRRGGADDAAGDQDGAGARRGSASVCDGDGIRRQLRFLHPGRLPDEHLRVRRGRVQVYGLCQSGFALEYPVLDRSHIDDSIRVAVSLTACRRWASGRGHKF